MSVDDWRARLPEGVVACVDDLGDGLRAALSDKLFALWLYGAITFPGSEDAICDIDFHAIVVHALTDGERDSIRALYAGLAERHGMLGEEMDGFFVLRSDSERAGAPRSQLDGALDTSWVLHRAHFHAGRVIVWHGPHPREVVVPPAWEDVARALRAEFDETLERWPDTPYAILQTCRVLLSLERKDAIVSKAEAGTWALQTLPRDWHALILAARRFYRGTASEEDRILIKQGASSFVRWGRDEA